MKDNKQKSGFEVSLEGKQDFPPKKVKVVKINPEWLTAEFEMEIKSSPVINIGPEPKKEE